MILPVDKLFKVPTDVILGWLAVWRVPVKLVADKFLILEISLFISNTIALFAEAIPSVILVKYILAEFPATEIPSTTKLLHEIVSVTFKSEFKLTFPLILAPPVIVNALVLLDKIFKLLQAKSTYPKDLAFWFKLALDWIRTDANRWLLSCHTISCLMLLDKNIKSFVLGIISKLDINVNTFVELL